MGGSVLGLTALRLTVASLARGETSPRGFAPARLVPVGTYAATQAGIRRGRLLAGWSRSWFAIMLLGLLGTLRPARLSLPLLPIQVYPSLWLPPSGPRTVSLLRWGEPSGGGEHGHKGQTLPCRIPDVPTHRWSLV